MGIDYAIWADHNIRFLKIDELIFEIRNRTKIPVLLRKFDRERNEYENLPSNYDGWFLYESTEGYSLDSEFNSCGKIEVYRYRNNQIIDEYWISQYAVNIWGGVDINEYWFGSRWNGFACYLFERNLDEIDKTIQKIKRNIHFFESTQIMILCSDKNNDLFEKILNGEMIECLLDSRLTFIDKNNIKTIKYDNRREYYNLCYVEKLT